MPIEVTIVLVLVGLLAFAGLFAGFYGLAIRPLRVSERVQAQAEKVRRPGFHWSSVVERSEKVIRPLGEMVPRSVGDMSRTERRLVQAGLRRKDGAILFYGVQAGLVVSFLVLFSVSGYLFTSLINLFLFSVISVFLGAAVPDLWLMHRIKRRKDDIKLALPDALDLMVVCVEAGLAMDQSMMRIGQEIRIAHTDLSDEFHLYNLEVNAGRTRAEALRNLSRRTDVEDLKALVAVLVQTDRFGTSVAQSLRVYSDTLRTKRRQRAEELAAKLPVKMIPPLIVFVFPAIFVAVAGPAVIAIIQQFGPALGRG